MKTFCTFLILLVLLLAPTMSVAVFAEETPRTSAVDAQGSLQWSPHRISRRPVTEDVQKENISQQAQEPLPAVTVARREPATLLSEENIVSPAILSAPRVEFAPRADRVIPTETLPEAPLWYPSGSSTNVSRQPASENRSSFTPPVASGSFPSDAEINKAIEQTQRRAKVSQTRQIAVEVPAPPANYSPSAMRIPGGVRAASELVAAPSLFSFPSTLMRTPQGEHGRQIYKPTGSAVRTSGRSVSEAPRYSSQPTRLALAPNTPNAPRARVAVALDGTSSVMSQPVSQPEAAEVNTAPAIKSPTRQPSSTEFSSPALGSPSGEIMPYEQRYLENEFEGMSSDGTSLEPNMGMHSGSIEQGMLMGAYPCEEMDCEDECGFLPGCEHTGTILSWMRRFGQPYYGWRWYRDFTASAGIASFQNGADLGFHGNYGTNEYANWSMPFWNAFGVGWQLGVRGVQTNFQPTSGHIQQNSRNQTFASTGFFTRAFEGRGLQGGASYDFLTDSLYGNVDIAQIRAEISYVWDYNEIGFWSASSLGTTTGFLRQTGGTSTVNSKTTDLYSIFYRLHFDDANEIKIWAGASSYRDGYIGSLIRSPLSKSLALEGTFAYLIPSTAQTHTFSNGTSISHFPSAWNVAVNLVFYPACRSRRSLASPYRPLFDVADNGTMIRADF